MAKENTVIGSAFFVSFETNNETEKKITTTKDASKPANKPGVPFTKNPTATTRMLVNNAGFKAPRNIEVLECSDIRKVLPFYLFLRLVLVLRDLLPQLQLIAKLRQQLMRSKLE